MTYEQDAKTLELPWPFTGREDELDLVRRSLTAGRHGIVVTGPVGYGKTRLATEAVRGTDCTRAAGTPETRQIPFAAFAHLLPERVTLHRAMQLLSGVRMLLVDDAHLLDDASAALVHQLAVHGRTRLLVVATDGAPVPGAISRLWTGELLPRLALEPLPAEETAPLLAAGAGGPLEPLTANRLHRLCQGDLRLLRDLLGALRDGGLLTRVDGTDERAWRGPVPVTPTVRERIAPALDRIAPDERETLHRLAFAEPLPLPMDAVDLGILERLEYDALIRIDDHGGVHLAHPLLGPALRATAGKLRARRLAGTPDRCDAALAAEQAALLRRIEQADVRPLATPVGEWLAADGAAVPAGYAAARARFARLRGELREAAAWAREGLRGAADDAPCRTELALAAAQSGEVTTPGEAEVNGAVAVWAAAARGDLDRALAAVDADTAYDVGRAYDADTAYDADCAYDAVRLGAPERATGRLRGVFAEHADALARGDGPALDRAAERLQERGFLLFAAEAHAQAVRAHRDPRAARTSRTRAVALARRCQSARTPALSGLAFGELTARQRQIVTLAAAGLSNRQIAEQLTLSVRTVGNHLYSAYARLGAGDRAALPWLVEQPA
ncbi:helix-turn-helix transcriptional regulator [Streptomyces spinoverrucosus]|uniref:Helix-turn-helix transcriptional regulator n=1 Tax=Streptomyces spinoverrucosus TaxID=284043 RepID=A0A4Y3VAN0_9ACTN|nr:LuxR C-terminal-related transcriptional regulator [Streptomyces spinoverrucosus]GEC02870.1 helix-turn-helix transcriptional regulator [Streptomyces spinoverrucosus]GHB39920.1 helix-turn-helix transcriptional regulator [Streptomyces spinoverrucosus]